LFEQWKAATEYPETMKFIGFKETYTRVIGSNTWKKQ